MNIRMEYLYRDAGNYKNWGEVVFSNPTCIPIKRVKQLVGDALFERQFFNANLAGLPDIHFTECSVELDHGWHEFHGLAETEDSPNDSAGRGVEQLIECLKVRQLI